MRKVLLLILALCVCSCSAFASEIPEFSFNFPRPHQDTLDDWAIASAIVQAIQRPNIPSKEFKLEASAEDVRKAIQDLINQASENGGGKVIIPAGDYFCKGPIELKSGVELHLEEGAKILFSPEPSDYLPVVKTRWEGTELMNYSPMIYAYGQHDIALTGKGTIDGNAESIFHTWKKLEKPDQKQLRLWGAAGVPVEERVFGEGHYLRPCIIDVNYCERVLLEDYTVMNSPFWINHLNCSNHVQMRGLKVNSMFANNDGVDVESCKYVLIEENTFRTGDDSVVVKSGRDYDGRKIGLPSKYVVIRKNDMGGEDGIALGSEMSGGIAYVFFEDNILRDGESAVRFKANLDRGGTCEHIRVRNMKIANFDNFIWFQLNYPGELGGNFPTVYKDLVFEDITVESLKGKLFECHAPKGYPLQDVMLRNIKIAKSEKTDFILENVSNLVIDNLEVNDQRMNGVLSSF
ncbi:MAG: glycoside hydrolase family 28 protein [Synergistaceae bacterium]|nr:glycoside hydrolase family 28 protein [Synergistaceae bacterium]